MENASKALLIAGAILILIILISLLLVVRNNITSFNASQDELQMTTDRAKFNEQFTRYNRDDVEGYELISLVNKVIDYNEKVSNKSYEGNNFQAEAISLAVTLWKDNTERDNVVTNLLTFDNTLRLFKKGKLVETKKTLNNDPNLETNLDKILDDVKSIKTNCSKIDVLTKKINSIILKNLKSSPVKSSYPDTAGWSSNVNPLTDNDKEEDRKSMLGALSVYESVTNDNTFRTSQSQSTKWKQVGFYYSKMLYDNIYGGKTAGNNNKTYMLKYYEYIQFTKAKFKCTKMDYSQTTGRVINLEFEFTGKIE